MINDELIAEARSKYKSLDGVVVVSPKLLSRLADALENASTTVEYDALYIANLEAILEAAKRPGWLGRNIDMSATATVDTSVTPREGAR